MMLDPQEIFRRPDGRYEVVTYYQDGTERYTITAEEAASPRYRDLPFTDETIPPTIATQPDGTISARAFENALQKAHNIRLAAGRLDPGYSYRVVVDYVKVGGPNFVGEGI